MSDSYIYDLDSYCRRIGYEGLLGPTLEVLRALAVRHVQTIPFENIDVLMGRGIDLSPQALEQKLIRDRRGGYCFEQNGLMLGILRQIGFHTTPLSGRVRMESTRDMLPPRTHLFLIVLIDEEEWIFDTGVGGLSLTSPIRRQLDIEQKTLHETRRIVQEDGKFFHQSWTGSDWVDVYEFSGEEMPEIDREVANWWTSCCPKAKFSQRLVCARASDNGERLTLLNDRFLRRKGKEVLEAIAITSADQLLEILNDRFGMVLPTGTRIGTGEKPWPIS